MSAFHQDIGDWRALVAQETGWPTNLVDIVRRYPNHLGFSDASGIGAGGVWLYPSKSRLSIMWRYPWPPDIIVALVSDTNTGGMLTNSDLELAALVIHKDTNLELCPYVNISTPRSGSDNTPTVS